MPKKPVNKSEKSKFSVRAEATAMRSYCRPKENGLIETWSDVTDRVIFHQTWLWERAQSCPLSPPQIKELQELRKLIEERKVCPSGRTLWLGGTEVSKTRESSQFNCSGLVVRSLFDIVDGLWLLLQGVGVGFYPEVGGLHGYKLPLDSVEVIRSERTTKGGVEHNTETFDVEAKKWSIQVGDSAEAWAKSVGKLLAGKYPAKSLVLDFSQIRPAGERLKGYGWISSGDEQIAKAFKEIAEILSNRADQLLSKIDILDVMNWLGTILSSRRSAEIALCEYGSPEWREFAVAKKDYFIHNPQRGQSNNSLIFYKKPTKQELEGVFGLILESGGSEPGFVNGEHALKRAPWFSTVNPCCQPGWAKVLTPDGIRNLSEINIGDQIWSSEGWSGVVNKWSTGIQTVRKIRTTAGTFYGTGDHRLVENGEKVEADLCNTVDGLEGPCGDAVTHDPQVVMDGLMIGDGSVHKASNYLTYLNIGSKDQDYLQSEVTNYLTKPRPGIGPFAWEVESDIRPVELLKTFDRSVPDRYVRGDRRTVCSFLRGLFSANGSICGQRVTLKASSFDVIESTQAMLSSIGILSYFTTNKPTTIEFANGPYDCKQSYDLNISTQIDRFQKLIGFLQGYKNEKLAELVRKRSELKYTNPKTTFKVVLSEDHSEEEVFDITVDNKSHTYWTQGLNVSNCEILLGDKSFCNLVEVNLLSFKGDLPGLKRAMNLAARMNYRQTCVDFRDGILQEGWHTNNDFLHLCGVGITGVTACPELSGYDYKMLKNIAVTAAHSMAIELELPLPKNVTTTKPSGSLSKIMGSEIWGEVPEGAHKPQGKHIFNEITFSKHDPMVKLFKDAGYNVMEKPLESESVLVRFPVKYDSVLFTKKKVTHKDGTTETVEVNAESAVEQLDRYKMLMDNWCEQNVSITIYYDPEEVPAITRWILKNWDSYVGVSFIYRSDPTKSAADLGYAYLPQSVISEKTYLDYISKLKPINFDSVHFLDVDLDKDCAGGSCPIR